MLGRRSRLIALGTLPRPLELDEIGRLALDVLDGGIFMGSRVVDLATAYLAVSHTSKADTMPGEAAS